MKVNLFRSKLPLLLAACTILFGVLFYSLFIIPKNHREYISYRSQYFERFERNLADIFGAAVQSEVKGGIVSRIESTNAMASTFELNKEEKQLYIISKDTRHQIGYRLTGIYLDSVLKFNRALFEDYIVVLEDPALKGASYALYSDQPGINADTLLQNVSKGQTSFEFGYGQYKKFVQCHVFNLAVPGLEANMKFSIFGITAYQTYKTQLNDLSSKLVIYFMITVLFLILINPLLKSVILGRFETLDVIDVLRTSTSFIIILQILIMLALSVLIFDFLRVDDSKQLVKQHGDMALKSTSSIVRRSVMNLDQMNLNLDASRRVHYVMGNHDSSAIDLTLTDSVKDYFSNVKALKIFSLCSDTGVNSGLEQFKIIFSKNNPTEKEEFLKVNSRTYFKKIIDTTNAFSLRVDSANEIKFYMEPLRSRVNSELGVAISIRDKKSTDVLCLGTKVDTFLTQPKLGSSIYESCIIDKSGEVLLHSNRQKILGENLFAEFSEPKLLLAALEAGTDETFYTLYGLKSVVVNVRPFADLASGVKMPGYYLVTFREDQDDSIFTATINSTVITFLIFFFILIAIITVLSMARVRAGVPFLSLKKFGWLYPDKNLIQKYALVFSANTIYFVILLFFSFLSPNRNVLNQENLYFMAVYLYASVFTTFILLTGQDKRGFFKYTALFVIYCLLVYASMHFFGVNTLMAFVIPLIFICVFLVYYFSQKTVSAKSLGYIVKKASSVFSIIVERVFLRLLPKLDNSFQRHYCTFILSVFVSWSVIPAFTIFKTVYEREKNAFCFYQEPEIQDLSEIKNSTTKPVPFSDFITKTRILNSTYAIKTRNFNTPVKLDELESIKAIIPDVKVPTAKLLFVVVLVVIALIIGALILFYIINYFVEKYFFIVVFENHKIQHLDTEIVNKILEHSINFVFLTGPPYSGKTGHAKKFLAADMKYKGNKVAGLSIDCIKLLETDLESLIQDIRANRNFVIVDHFEYDILSQPLNDKKYQLLTRLLGINGIQVVIASTVHPSEFMDVYLKKCCENEKDFEQKYVLWNELFINFYKLYYPLQGIRQKKAEEVELNDVRMFLRKECNHGHYLKQLIEPLEKFIKEGGNGHRAALNIELYGDRETVINKIESMAYWYYLSLWNFLSNEEKFIIVDLSQDGYVNLNNHNALITLINKGLIIQEEGILRVFNESFSKFIINHSKSQNLTVSKKSNEYVKTWQNIRLPISIILFSIVFFLLTTQNDFYNSLIGSLTSAIVGITLCINIFRSFYPKGRNA